MAVLVSLDQERVRRRPPVVWIGSRAYRVTRPRLARVLEWVAGPLPHAHPVRHRPPSSTR
jgi:hypothetical protein